MAWLRSLFLLALAGLSFACAPSHAEPPQPVEIALSRSVCFGFCPDYTVRISGDGEVVYDGRAFVSIRGEARAQIPRSEVAALLARFDAIGFDRLRDHYRANVTDMPTFTLTLTRNGRSKRVIDYAGTMAGMPESVRALQDEIDRVAGTARWVLRDGERVRDRPER